MTTSISRYEMTQIDWILIECVLCGCMMIDEFHIRHILD